MVRPSIPRTCRTEPGPICRTASSAARVIFLVSPWRGAQARWHRALPDFQTGVRREAEDEGINARSRQMPNETHLKRLISDAVFEAHNTHGGHAAGDRLYISREDSRIIASAVFDVLRRANVLLIDQPGQSNP